MVNSSKIPSYSQMTIVFDKNHFLQIELKLMVLLIAFYPILAQNNSEYNEKYNSNSI